MKVKDEKKASLIYNATLNLVEQHGLAGIKMGDIAKEAGMATGTLYIYFKNKEELINTLFLECRKAAANSYFKGYELGSEFRENFRTIWMNMSWYKSRNIKETIFIEQCYHSPYITESTHEVIRQLFDPLFELLERGKKEGVIKEVETFLLISYVVGISNEIVKTIHYRGDTLTQELVDTIFSLCWDGIKK